MSEELSETRLLINGLIHPNCDCEEIDNLANALDDAASSGKITQREAILCFTEARDSECEGKIPNPSPIIGCGSPEFVCGNCKGAQFLILETMRVRSL